LLISLAYSFAEVPCKINYQGRLIKDNVPVDGTKTMVFSIYAVATGGSPIWTSENVSVEVHNGLFRYVLGTDGGDLSSIDWTAGQALYLQVMVDGETLTPREELSAYPYAINSHLLDGTDKSKFNVERSDVGSGVDWNTLTTPGSYGVLPDFLTGANSPKATYSGIYTYGVVVVEEYNGRGIVQTYYPHTGTGASYIVRRTGWNNGSWQSWVKVWDAGSDGSGSGLDADLVDGYHVSTTRNAANTVPVRDGNGYLQLGWINTTSGSAGTNAPDRIYGSYDTYIRYYTPANFATVMASYLDNTPDSWTGTGDVYTTSGNVGIGTTSPGAKLEVQGGPIKATGGLIIETRTTDPTPPATGQMWLRSDIP